MDLYNPVKDNNLYGARAKKNVSQLQAICASLAFSFIMNDPR
jgi:hypothetical protein